MADHRTPADTVSPDSLSGSRHGVVWIVVLVLMAFALRLLDLSYWPVWEDEAATWWFGTDAGSSVWSAVLSHIRSEPTPPLYYFLVGTWLAIVGDSDFWLRFPSAVFGALSVGAVCLLGRRLFSLRAGLAAGLWLAIHPWHLVFSREARAYTLLLMLSLLLWWVLWQALQTDRLRHWVAVSVLLAVACWSHFFALFLGVAAVISILFLARDQRMAVRGLIATSLAGLAFVPYLLTSIPGLQKSGADWSVARRYELHPQASNPAWVAAGHAIGARRSPFERHLAEPRTPFLIWLPATGAQALLCALTFGFLWRRSKEHRRRGLFVGLIWLVPMAIPWLISVLHRPILQPGRHDFLALGLSALVVGVGFDILWSRKSMSGEPVKGRRLWARRVLAGGLAAAIAAAALFRLAWIHVAPTDESPRQLGVFLAEHTDEKSLILATGLRRLQTERYLRLAGGASEIKSYPASTDLHPGWADPTELVPQQKELAREAHQRIGDWAAAQASDGAQGSSERLWVIPRHYPEDSAVRRQSELWLVDRHLFAALAKHARPVALDLPSGLEGKILAFDRVYLPKAANAEPGQDRSRDENGAVGSSEGEGKDES